MRKLFVTGGMLAAFLLLPAAASADWVENFDGYTAGTSLHGVGGWYGWDNDPQWEAFVSTTQARSPANSVEITTTADLVHPFSGYTSGKWIFTAWVYIPSTYAGQSYFLLQNTYNHGGPYDWSVQMYFDSASGLVKGWFGSNTEVTGPAYVTDAWSLIQVQIDLDNDWTQVFYNGYLFDDPTVADHDVFGAGYSWTLGIFGAGGGALDIGAVDLFANAANEVYYDDLSLHRASVFGDDFEAYAAGSSMHGQGGWAGWDNDPQWTANISTTQARSGANSVDINGTADLVMRFAGRTAGKHTFKAWQYIPTGFAGQSFFIMLNTYNHGGPYDWSVQFDFDSATGQVGGNFGSGTHIDILPYVVDQWVLIQADVYLDDDWVQLFYDGTLLDDPAVTDHPTLGGGYQWTGGVFGGGSGALNIGALDLFASNASTIYYDDVAMEPFIHSFQGDASTISEATGGQVNFTLSAGVENGDRPYLILGSISGIEPGIDFNKGGNLPLNWDVYTGFVLGLINTPTYDKFSNVLDDIGAGTATFDVPAPIPGTAGLVMYYAYGLDKPLNYGSNPWVVTIVP